MRYWKRYAIAAALVVAYVVYSWFAGAFGVDQPRRFEDQVFLAATDHGDRIVVSTSRITEYFTPWPWRFLFGKTLSYTRTDEVWGLDAATLKPVWRVPVPEATKIVSVGNADGLVWIKGSKGLLTISLDTGAVAPSIGNPKMADTPESAEAHMLLDALEVTAFDHWYALLTEAEAAKMAVWLKTGSDSRMRPSFYTNKTGDVRRFYSASLVQTDEYPVYGPKNYGPVEQSERSQMFMEGRFLTPADGKAWEPVMLADPDSLLIVSNSAPGKLGGDRLSRIDAGGRTVWSAEVQLMTGLNAVSAFWPKDALIVSGLLQAEAYTPEEAADNHLRSIITRIDLKTGGAVSIRDDRLPD